MMIPAEKDMLEVLRDGARAAKAKATALRTDAAKTIADAKRHEMAAQTLRQLAGSTLCAARQYDETARRFNEMMAPSIIQEVQS